MAQHWGKHWSREFVLGLGFCLLLALALRLVFFRGVYLVDDFSYLRHAAECWKGRFDFSQVLYWHAMRPLVFVPVSAFFALLGVSSLTAVLWSLLLSIATVAVVYLIGRQLGGPRVGFVAAAVVAFCPLAVDEATRVLPGEIQNFLIAASVYCYLRSESAATGRTRWLVYSGAVFGAMPLAGHLGLGAGSFFVLAILLFRRHRFWSYWPLLASVLTVFLVPLAAQWVFAGNPLLSVDVANQVLTTEVPPFRPLYYVRHVLNPLSHHGGVLYLAAFAALAVLWRGPRQARLFALWLIAVGVFIELGSTSLVEYRPIPKLPRYLSVLVVPSAVVIGMGLLSLHDLLRRFRLPIGRLTAGSLVVGMLLAAVFAGSIVTLKRLGDTERPRHDLNVGVARWVERYRGRPVYVMHWLWNSRVGFFTHYDNAYFPTGFRPYGAVRLETVDPHSLNRYVQTLTPGDSIDSGMLIIDERILELSRGPERRSILSDVGEVPEVLFSPPPEWRLLQRFDGVALYDVPAGIWPGTQPR